MTPSLQTPVSASAARRRRLAFVTLGTLALLLLSLVVPSAQDVTEPALKAAYIYNFAKFTEWPDDVPAAEPILMCVLGDGLVAEALLRAVTGRTLGRHPIVTSGVVTVGSTRACHVVYVSGIPASQAGQLVAGLRDVPVLTLSDVEGFTNVGGIAQFFFEHGRLRFKIQLEAAKRARLLISSKLLILAKLND